MKPQTTIIPIAAGKGGVGKTFLSANLGIALGELGKHTIVIDLDLGGSNLYSFLGIANRYPGIGDFLKARTGELYDLQVKTSFPNLSYIPGDGKTPFLANIAYAQKVKLLSRIQRLEADFIILDLGAGSSFNTLDYFGVADWGLVVITPEYPSVMGMLVFLKNYLFRIIKRRLSGNHHVQNLLRKTFNRPIDDQVPSITELQRVIAAADPEAGRQVLEVYAQCRPRVIFNRGSHPSDSQMAANISRSFNDILSIQCDYFGFIFDDANAREAISRNKPFLTNYRQSLAADNITRIAQRVAKYWHQPVKDSAARIQQYAQESYSRYLAN
jgi:flagellar biosynthesis protein FlhG